MWQKWEHTGNSLLEQLLGASSTALARTVPEILSWQKYSKEICNQDQIIWL